MSELGVRRGKAAFFSGGKSHPAIALAGSYWSSHGGNEVAEPFSIACHELVSLDFRSGSGDETARAVFCGGKRRGLICNGSALS